MDTPAPPPLAGSSVGPTAAARRKTAIQLAIFTSMLSKGGTVLIMLMALPLAFKMLGPDRAAVFGALQSIMWIVALSDLGIGPGLSRRIAAAAARDDKAALQQTISTAMLLVCLLALLTLILGSAFLYFGDLIAFFGENFAPHRVEMTQNAWLGLLIFSGLVILYQMERIREGLQEVHITNAWGAALNICVAASLILAFPRWPGVSCLLLSLYGLQLLFLSGNVGMLLRRPWLRPSLKYYDSSLGMSLIREGFILFLAGSVAPIILREAPRYMLGKYISTEEYAASTIFIQLGLFGFGFITMLTRPLYPAFADAAARQDFAWIDLSRRRMIRWAPVAVIIIVTGFAALGPWFINIWIKHSRSFTHAECGIYGLTFAALIWSHLHYIILGSMKRAAPVAIISLLEASLAIVLCYYFIHPYGLDGALAGCAAASLLTSAWLLPLVARKICREGPASLSM